MRNSRTKWLECVYIVQRLSDDYAAVRVSVNLAMRNEEPALGQDLSDARKLEQILHGKFLAEQRMVEEFNAFGMLQERATQELSDYDEMTSRAEGCWVDFLGEREKWLEWLRREREADEERQGLPGRA